jgi:hypothetical protein
MKWMSGSLAWGYFYDNVTHLDLYTVLTECDTWYIILYNQYSTVSSLNGHITITKVIDRPTTGAMFDQSFQLGPKEQTNYAFWVYDSPSTLHIEVSADGNLQVAIFNETEAMKWMSGSLAWGYFYDNVTNLDLYKILTEYDTWYIILYNRYSDFSSRSGHIKVTKVTDQPVTGEMFDQDFQLGTGDETNYVFWVYEAPTTLHIEVNSDGALRIFICNETQYKKLQSVGYAQGDYQYHIVDHLDLYQILPDYGVWYIILDHYGASVTSISGHITITKVSEFKGPSIDQPADISVDEAQFDITWRIFDDNPASYIIYRNGSELFSNTWDGWRLAIHLTLSVLGLEPGDYNTTTTTTTTSTTTTTTTTTTTQTKTTTTTTEPKVTSGLTSLMILSLLPLVVLRRKKDKNL